MASYGSPGIWGRLKNFDAYPKTMESFRIKTLHGAAVTIISSLFMLGLFLSEVSYFLTLDVRQELFVDTGRSRGERLRINIDMIFPKWPCAYLSIDAMDISGEQQFDLQHSIYKTRVDEDGNKIVKDDEGEKTEPGEGKLDLETLSNSTELQDNSEEDTKEETDPHRCLSCYGAETESIPCCNTCEQVREAYRRKGWAINDHDVIEQCANEGWKDHFDSQSKEGCIVQGFLEVSKVAGNFHFAPGHSYQQQSVHVHDLHLFGKNARFNVTHKVNKLSFGHEYPGMDNPLDGHMEVDGSAEQEGNSMYQYFVKIVPTHYWKSNGTVLKTNQYSVTKHKRSIKLSIAENGLPGVFFIYDINPMMIQLREGRKSFLHFLTGVCAIIGGIFTVAGMIDALIYQSNKALQKKIDLGKAT
ncbi:Endoplasmic reticulum-Golgi intermediate compartment protein 3-like [Oopsacas minuta]|uniref:Endoplasmic reticulum-Golgi intermediate compartment protein 3 n=1 Tax=Oopsacas minuta TaxID=111878 RepID=A0AAV7JAM4_9METZ|nr:Endoplasmic reticulum-Golgi intermediate compartment protein 3-like [Oopsacas minuta]